MREVCCLFGVEKLRTTPYKPSTNQVERFHRTLNSILGKTVAEHQKDWDCRLVFAMSAYRATRHRATGYSPNFLVLGTETRAPPDIVYGHEEPGEDYDPYVERLRGRLVKAYREVRGQLQRSAGYNKRYYDVSVRPVRFEAGQSVWYFNPRKLQGRQMKWTPQYEGPYLVLKMLSPVVAKIQQSHRTKPKIVHVDKLKKFEGEEPRMWPAAEVALGARRDGGHEGVTGPYIPSFSAKERSSVAGEEARALGEARDFFGDGGPADEPLASSPVTEGMESVDGLTAPPSFVQSGHNQTTNLLEPTDGLMYPTRGLMETSERCESESSSSPVARPITLHGLLEIISLHFSIVLSVSMKFSPGGASPPAWLFQNPRWPPKYLRMCCNAGLA